MHVIENVDHQRPIFLKSCANTTSLIENHRKTKNLVSNTNTNVSHTRLNLTRPFTQGHRDFHKDYMYDNFKIHERRNQDLLAETMNKMLDFDNFQIREAKLCMYFGITHVVDYLFHLDLHLQQC